MTRMTKDDNERTEGRTEVRQIHVCELCGASGTMTEINDSRGKRLCRLCYLRQTERSGPDLPEGARLKAAKSRSKRTPRQNGYPATDSGNAEYLAWLYGDAVRFDHRQRRWLLWEGHRWKPDSDGRIARLAINAARNRYQGASEIGDLGERQHEARWAISSESRQKIDACIALAKNLKPIADDGENWDRNPWLLAVSNGVVDLKTGKLRPGHPEDRITMSTGIDFDPTAKCPRWEQFLGEVFVDPDLMDWLWRVLGYSISGDTSEQIVLMGHGSGANGKGVITKAMDYALGDYAYTAPFSTFELHKRASIPNDLAELESKRFVFSSETNDNTRLNEARIKALSGRDPITARHLYREHFTFEPHLKLWLFVNHRPAVRDDSFGFWRRVRLIPFTRQFTGKDDDRQLGEKLRAEAPGILAWLVRGCLGWQRRGLGPVPQCVEVATQEYQQESDPLAEFVAERCTERPEAECRASELYSAYKDWARSRGYAEREVLTSTTFGRRMGDRYSKAKSHGQIVYRGIGLTGGGSGEGLTLNDTEGDVSSMENRLREENLENPPNYPPEREDPPDPSHFHAVDAGDAPVDCWQAASLAARDRGKKMWETDL